jgi:hypothetical protein
MAKTNEKDALVRPIRRVALNIGENPESFFDDNRHIVRERVIEHDKLVPVLPIDDPRKALFIVYLTWFDSPLRANSDISSRITQAAEWAGALDKLGNIPTGWDPRIKESSAMRTYMNRFLTYQQDIHHSSFVKLELLLNSIFEQAMRKPEDEGALKTFREFVNSFAEIDMIRLNNYKCGVNLNEMREAYTPSDSDLIESKQKEMPPIAERGEPKKNTRAVEST